MRRSLVFVVVSVLLTATATAAERPGTQCDGPGQARIDVLQDGRIVFFAQYMGNTAIAISGEDLRVRAKGEGAEYSATGSPVLDGTVETLSLIVPAGQATSPSSATLRFMRKYLYLKGHPERVEDVYLTCRTQQGPYRYQRVVMGVIIELYKDGLLVRAPHGLETFSLSKKAQSYFDRYWVSFQSLGRGLFARILLDESGQADLIDAYSYPFHVTEPLVPSFERKDDAL